MSSNKTSDEASRNDLSQAGAVSADEQAARTFYVMDQLTTLYGFAPSVAEQAVEAVGADAEACCTYILDHQLAEDQGGPVFPVDHCPHLNIQITIDALPPLPQATSCSHVSDGTRTGRLKATTSDDGYSCPSSNENWICLECGVIRCSRYANAHATAHFEASGHSTVISLADLSVWCYQCQAYVANRDNQTLCGLLEKLEKRKFSNE
jgi:uncharacterized UBP type Zn finger protein